MCGNERSGWRAEDAHTQHGFGEWLSLVEHLVRDQGVGGSNPLSPTIFKNQVAQALAKGRLGKDHGQILLPTREPPRSGIARIAFDTAAEFAVGKKSDQLLEDGVPLVHAPSSANLDTDFHASARDSNRGKNKLPLTIYPAISCRKRM